MISSRLLSGLFTCAVAATALTLPALPASAASGPINCPSALPTNQAVDGLTGTGYTVERGTTPDPFSATVLGRITDGIAPGIDMILANLNSPALTRAGGVWEGMSGSPVYTASGDLIGSVSYGLASTSTIAGITPATDMQKLLSIAGATTARVKVGVTRSVVTRLARTGAVSAAAAAEGFELLKTPVSLSGAQGSRFAPFVNHLAAMTPNGRIRVGGTTAGTTAHASASDITAGSNFAAALSYGAVTMAAVGTTTFVCSGQAVAFGHPFLGTGAVQFSAHTASAVTVQPDISAPFKVANPGGVVGVVNQDRTPGIRAQLGATPASFTISTSLSDGGSTPQAGTTTVVYQPYAPDIAAIHTQTMIDALRRSSGPGSAYTKLRISGQRADGSPFTLRVSDHIASTVDLSYAVADQLYSTVSQLVDQPFEKVQLTGIWLSAKVSDDVNLYRVTSLKVANSHGTWIKPPSTIKVSQGHVIRTQLTLTKYQSTTTIVVPISVRAPQGTSGLTGTLDVEGGATGNATSVDPTSFAGLLKSLASAPTNDQLMETLSLDTGSDTLTVSSSKHIPAGIDLYSNVLDVEVK